LIWEMKGRRIDERAMVSMWQSWRDGVFGGV
jgi:hypothetical protein